MQGKKVVPYIGTWIETIAVSHNRACVVPYIGTWIETCLSLTPYSQFMSYLI